MKKIKINSKNLNVNVNEETQKLCELCVLVTLWFQIAE